MSAPQRYTYRPKKWPGILGVLFFGIGSIFLVHSALHNEKELIISYLRIIKAHLSVTEATIFFAILAFTSFALTLLSFVVFYKSFTSKHEIFITNESITLPKSLFSGKVITILFKDIQDITRFSSYGTHTITIKHKDGKTAFSNAVLKNNEEFEEIVSYLLERTSQK
ncbi:MAG: hypothetical protein ACTHJ4_05290 [Candidatus Nucleicultricaceae bacterium]